MITNQSINQYSNFFYLLFSRGDFIGVRAEKGFYLARALEDCFIMRGDGAVYAFWCEWCQEINSAEMNSAEMEDDDNNCGEENLRIYIMGCGRDTILSQTVFHRFGAEEIQRFPDGRHVRIADHVPDLEALSDDLY